MRKTLLILVGSLGLGVAGAYAQGNIRDTGVPILNPADILPAAGTVVNETRVVFSGSATDVAGTGTGQSVSGVERVEYRVSGTRWRRATLTAYRQPATDFFFTVSIPKGTSRTVFIRVTDRKGNQSDTIGRRVTHSKILVRAAGTVSTTTPPPTTTPFGG